jgi:hypothetical protein
MLSITVSAMEHRKDTTSANPTETSSMTSAVSGSVDSRAGVSTPPVAGAGIVRSNARTMKLELLLLSKLMLSLSANELQYTRYKGIAREERDTLIRLGHAVKRGILLSTLIDSWLSITDS